MGIFNFFKKTENKPLESNDNLGNLSIKGNRVFIDDREIVSASTSNIHVSVKNGRVLVNGKEPVYKE